MISPAARFIVLLLVPAAVAVYAQSLDDSSSSSLAGAGAALGGAASPLVSVPVKVIEGVDVAGVVGSGMNDAGIDPTQAHPETMHGPEALFPLSGLCFCESADRMEYCVCPFRNVTMRRVTGGRATVLGVFGSWVGHRSSSSSPLGNDNLVMEFFRGQACGQGTRRVSVEIVPDAAEYVLDAASIEENPACHTQMRLLVPLPRDLLTDPSRFLARRWDSSPAPPSSVEAASSGGEVGAVGTTPQTGHTHTHMQASSGLAPIEPPVAPSSPLVPADRDKLVALEVKLEEALRMVRELLRH